MADSNKLSTSTGKEVASNLSLTIQDYNAQVINAQVGGLFNEYVDILLSLRRSVLIFKASYDDWDTMQSWLWQHVKMLQATTGPIDGLYIGYSNGDALFSTPMGVQVKMAQLRNCSFCFPADVGKPNRTYYFVNTTNGLGTPYGAGNYTRAAYNTLTRPWFIQGMLSNVSLVQLTPVYRYTSDTLGTTLIDTLFYPNGTKLGVIGLDANFLKLNPILTKLKSTPNTFIYVMQEDGTVYGNSYNESCINVNSTIVTKKPADMTNPLLKLTGTYLLGISNGNLSMLPNSSVYNLKNGSNTILFQVTLISVANGKLAIVGAPSSDYVGNIDQVIVDLDATLQSNTTKIILVAVLVFIFVVAISVLFTYLGIVVPLRKLSKIMEDATTYEFSALKDQKTVDSRSIILELEAMQASFFQMIKNFADAIQSNKELLNSKGSGTKLSRGDASESSFNV